MYKRDDIDVICQHNSDGSIIPLRIRFCDEDSIIKTYAIQSYKAEQSTTTLLPNGVYVTKHIKRFTCRLEVFGMKKEITLLYNTNLLKWTMCY